MPLIRREIHVIYRSVVRSQTVCATSHTRGVGFLPPNIFVFHLMFVHFSNVAPQSLVCSCMCKHLLVRNQSIRTVSLYNPQFCNRKFLFLHEQTTNFFLHIKTDLATMHQWNTQFIYFLSFKWPTYASKVIYNQFFIPLLFLLLNDKPDSEEIRVWEFIWMKALIFIK